MAVELHRLRLAGRYVAACMGSDGVDGISPAAGALVDESLVPEALEEGLDPEEYLERNDSYTLLSRLDRAIDTHGYTGVNVNDILMAVTQAQDSRS